MTYTRHIQTGVKISQFITDLEISIEANPNIDPIYVLVKTVVLEYREKYKLEIIPLIDLLLIVGVSPFPDL